MKEITDELNQEIFYLNAAYSFIEKYRENVGGEVVRALDKVILEKERARDRRMFLGMKVMISLGAGVVSMLCYFVMPSLAIALLVTIVALVLSNQKWEVV
jgi:hypothetical protein